ncbi:thymidylate kinase [Streptomyces sp. DH-12]|uniref:dTMP kinase n=1 Tax=Streptomyces sp. DH-12 TaxID=2072509 RepID=UPI000CCDE667|nr:thymidylate kinase [Streptomyces sp. DH-12]PNV30953.1 thymidylate kinase [Streptomyces sp. DH-12]
MIVAIVGADGAGKTTVTRAVAEALGGSATVADRWDIIDNPEYPFADFIKPDERRVRTCAVRMAPKSRVMFLLWAAVASVTDRQSPPDPAEVLLLDGYWMKHAAGEIAYGMEPPWVEAVGAGLPPADIVVYLRSDPETAWERMGERAVPYECGLDMSCSKESFLSHQQKIHEVLDTWADRFGWTVVDAHGAFPVVVDTVLEHVRAHEHEKAAA